MSNPMPARMPPSKTGDRFGRLLLLGEVPGETGAPSKRRWNCLCTCGSTSTPILNHLRSGNTVSCGCVRLEKVTTHGLALHPLYKTWSGMVQRCTDPEEPNYHNYGGRGVFVCRRWLEPANFIADMDHGYSPGLTLDRVDNSLGYSPENCRWATRVQQARNRRDNHLISHQDRNICLAEACELAGLKYTTAKTRLSAGWPIQKALGPEFGPPIL
jgi:hypothetical protein